MSSGVYRMQPANGHKVELIYNMTLYDHGALIYIHFKTQHAIFCLICSYKIVLLFFFMLLQAL